MSMRKTSSLVAVSSVMLVPAVALAHPGHGGASGLGDGLLHPLTGVDHVLAMVAVAMLAARFGGRARWALPGAFVACGALGAALALAGAALPLVETMIVASVLVGGVLLLRGESAPTFALAIVPLFGFFHGYAHLSELPNSAEALGYSAGILLASTALIGGLMLFATAARRYQGERLASISRLVGAGMTAAAVLMMLT